MDDELLIRRLQKNKRDSFPALYEQYHECVLYYAMTMLKDRYEAEEAYLKAVEIDPTSYESYLSMAAMYREDNQPAKAIAALKKVIPIKPDLHEIYVDIAVLILSIDSQDNKNRTKDLNDALNLVNTSLNAYSDYSRG